MAEGLLSSVQKKAERAKERILQKVGSVDQTVDETFDEHENVFNEQQNTANKWQKEADKYYKSLKTMQAASKVMYECLAEIYEPEWPDSKQLNELKDKMQNAWEEMANKLSNEMVHPVNAYSAQFSEMKKKIEKRSRKLVDYDGARHALDSLTNAKKTEEGKIASAQEKMEEAKRTFEDYNQELISELPVLYESRIKFFGGNLENLFSIEQKFHTELGQILEQLGAITKKLGEDKKKGKGGKSNAAAPSKGSPAKGGASSKAGRGK